MFGIGQVANIKIGQHVNIIETNRTWFKQNSFDFTTALPRYPSIHPCLFADNRCKMQTIM